MYNYKIRRSQRGVTLVELLIASTLGIIIVLGVSRSMTSMTQSSRVQLTQNTLQQTADLALSYLELRLRNAMATPCNQFNQLEQLQISPLVEAGKISTTAQTKINHLITGLGIDVEQNTNIPLEGISVKDSNGNTVANPATDNILLIGAADRLRLDGESGIPEPSATSTSILTIKGKFTPSSHDNKKLYVITNCQQMNIFRASRSPAGTVPMTLTTAPNTTFLINYRGKESALVSRLSAATLGIDRNGNLYDKPIFKTTAGNTLMDDIQLIRLLFGVDTHGNDGIIDRYITANQLSELAASANILTAEVFILAKASDSKSSTVMPPSYTLSIPDTSKNLPDTGAIPTQTLTITDRVMRKVFTRSVAFRNKATF